MDWLMVYYNENDPFNVEWLKQLIKAGVIANGEVDGRSIEDVCPNDLKGFSQHHFFAGIGVWSYALKQAGCPDDKPVWSGSCPCQSFSQAGKRKGFADERHLWPAWFWLISQSRPELVFGEQVATSYSKEWLDLVSSDLEGIGYACGSVVTPACGFGAPFIGNRLYFCAAPAMREGLSPRNVTNEFRKANETFTWCEFERVHAKEDWKEWDSKSKIRVFADGVANYVGRLRGYGNAIVASQAVAFVKAFMSSDYYKE